LKTSARVAAGRVFDRSACGRHHRMAESEHRRRAGLFLQGAAPTFDPPTPRACRFNAPWLRVEGTPLEPTRNGFRSALELCGWWPPLGMPECPSAGWRLSAGREQLSREAQILCLPGGRQIRSFYGDTLLTTAPRLWRLDRALLAAAGP